MFGEELQNISHVKVVTKVKLLVNTELHRALKSTMQAFSHVRNTVSDTAFRNREFKKYGLQKLCYQDFREKYPEFSSQLTLRAIDVVCQSYKIGQKNQTFFKKNSAVVYDDRVISFKENVVSIWTTEGRLTIPIHTWNTKLFQKRKGQVDLVMQNKQFFLIVTCDVEEKEEYQPLGWLGVDLGIVNIATDSLGERFSGEQIEKVRQKKHAHRQRLQIKNTKNSRKRLRKVGNSEARFRANSNHVISKKLVEKAKGTKLGIALEELSHIRERTTVRKSQRAKHSGWAFAQLRQFITYKAKREGVPLRVVNAAYTSQTCSGCGYCSKENRKSQDRFLCMSCGHAEHADFNASKNIAFRAAVNQPIAVSEGEAQAIICKPMALVMGS